MLFTKILKKNDFNIKKLNVFQISTKIVRIIISNSLKKFDDIDVIIIDELKNILSINEKF